MRIVRSKKGLPRLWGKLPGADKALHIADIYFSGRGSIKLKLLVFRNNRDLCAFWKKSLEQNLCRGTRGAVQQLRITHEIPHRNKVWMEVDPNYFAVMGLLVTHLGQEVIAHESSHAGFAYAKRMGSRSRWYDDDNEEEEVCYAVGKIASAVNMTLHETGLYEEYNKIKKKLKPSEDTEQWKRITAR